MGAGGALGGSEGGIGRGASGGGPARRVPVGPATAAVPSRGRVHRTSPLRPVAPNPQGFLLGSRRRYGSGSFSENILG